MNSTRQHFVFVWLAVWLTALALVPGREVRAESGPATVFIVDGSGSMAGKLPGEPGAKIDDVRGLLKSRLTTIPAGTPAGLVSLGHRRKADCSDVELFAPVEADAASRISEAIDTIRPTGKGPIGLALREATKAIGPGNGGNIILIHDSADNCQQDVCAIAEDISKSNPGLAIHVLSLGLEKADAGRVQCAAPVTGGVSAAAANRAGIEAAFDEIFRAANLAPRPDAPSANDGKPAVSEKEPPGLRLSAVLAARGPAVEGPLSWSIARQGPETTAALDRNTSAIDETLEPGRYSVTVRQGLISRTAELDVTAEGRTVANISLEAGTLALSAVSSPNGQPPLSPVIAVTPAVSNAPTPAKPIWIGRSASTSLLLPAGAYALSVTDGLATQTSTVEIPAGKTYRADIVLDSGRLELSATAAEGGPPLENVLYTIAVDDAEAPQGRREIARSTATNPDFTLQAGTYYVTARLGSAEVRDQIAISAGATVQRTLTLGLVKLTVKPVLAAPPDATQDLPIFTRIMETDGEKRLVAQSTDATPVFMLGAGRYRIEARLGTLNVRTSEVADLAPGRDVTAALTLEAGGIDFDGVGAAASVSSGPHVALRDLSGRLVWRSRPGQPLKTLAAPGAYVLQVESGTSRSERPLTIKAKDRLTVPLANP